MIAEVKLLISTEANPAEINAFLPEIIQKGLTGTEDVIVRVTNIEMSWHDWAEKMIEQKVLPEQQPRVEEHQIIELEDKEMIA